MSGISWRLLRRGGWRSGGWVVGLVLSVSVGTTACSESAGHGDPLRVPWSRAHAAPMAHSADSVGGSADDSDAADAHRREMRGIHSPLEAGPVAIDTSMAGSCRDGGCHQEMAATEAIHSRVAAIQCVRCHEPDGEVDEHRFRTVEDDGRVCRACHPKQATIAARHPPVREFRCLACHTPHGHPDETLLRSTEPRELCAGCHPLRQNETVHGPYADGDCLACHQGHGSDVPGILRERADELCLECHDREISVPDREQPIANMASLLTTSLFRHGPIRSGECTSCHDPHAALYHALLDKPFPAEFYQEWNESHYALCFSCHPNELATAERTSTATGFRHGDRNLHAVHVHGPKGRSCRACHGVHASSVPFHLRESVPFGGWQLPIVYVRAETGGTCVAGCHQEQTYDRTATHVAPPSE